MYIKTEAGIYGKEVSIKYHTLNTFYMSNAPLFAQDLYLLKLFL